MNEEKINCLICDNVVPMDTRYPIFHTVTPHSGVLLKDFLHKVTRICFNETETNANSCLCKGCFTLLEQFDFSENYILEIKKQIYHHLEKKYGTAYAQDAQFIEVACQTEKYLLQIQENVEDETDIKPDICNEPIYKSYVNQISVNDNSEGENLSCRLCSELFTTSADLKKHIKSHDKTFTCKYCLNVYNSKTGLSTHILKKHKVDIRGSESSVFIEPSDLLECDIKVENTEAEAESQRKTENSGSFDEYENDIAETAASDTEYNPPTKQHNIIINNRRRGRPPKTRISKELKVQKEEDIPNASGSDLDEKPLIDRKFSHVKTEKYSDNESNSDFENHLTNSFNNLSDTNSSSGQQFMSIKRRRGRPKKNSESDRIDIFVRPYIYQCPQCPKKWRTKSELRIHLCSHSDVRAHVCEICGQAYKKRAALDIHLGMHNGINPYTCNVCGKVFTQKGALNRHLPIHTGEANYQCDLCGKRFIHHTSFSMHALTHSGLKAYKCEICGLGLMSTSHLKRHMRAHSGEKKYGCSQCGKRFAERYNLAAHERLHFSPGEKRKRTHPCPLCGDTFQRRQKLEEHLASNHNKIIDNDESKKWAGTVLNNSGNLGISAIAGLASSVLSGAQQSWSVFTSDAAFPTSNIKSPPEESSEAV